MIQLAARPRRARLALLLASALAAVTLNATTSARAQDRALDAPTSAATAARPIPTIRVGSKAFTESVILGELAVSLTEHAGALAVHKSQLGGTPVCWEALLRGEIDIYPEYTGTITGEILAAANLRHFDDIRVALAKQGIGISQPLGFNNTYALGMPNARAEALGIRTISDLRNHPDLVVRPSPEFLERDDGWPNLAKAYDLPHTDVTGLEHALAYTALQAGSVDVMDLYSTDAEIEAYDIRTLVDDRAYFPQYDAVFLYRLDLVERAPVVLATILQLEGKIDEATMIAMNAAARDTAGAGAIEAQVAARFLPALVDLEGPVASDARGFDIGAWTSDILGLTGQHLFLVGVSLLAAILVAVPLGLVAFRKPRFGQIVLGTVGILQTIPSIALLLLMIPFFGLGVWPAIVALFLYSLLPIVRNTHAGMAGISPALRESAAALGLPRGARLRAIELPLSARSILAGIKTAAVINVGTATLGGFIGAGGYGDPIITGIRLGDTGFILKGAIPAAALALLIQGAFDLCETRLVSKGLRLKPAIG